MSDPVHVQVWQVGEADSEHRTQAEEESRPMIVVVYIFFIAVGLIPLGLVASNGLIVRGDRDVVQQTRRPLHLEEVLLKREVTRGLHSQLIVDGDSCKDCQ